MEIDLPQLLTWLSGFGGAYAAVEVRIRWLRSDLEKIEERVENLEAARTPRSA